MTGFPPFVPSVLAPLDIAILTFPDFQLLDLSGPATVFETAGHFVRQEQGYRIRLLSVAGALVRSSSGVAVDTQALRRDLEVDTLLVPGGVGTRRADLDRELIRFIKHTATRCRRVASVCTGAFLLAQAGLLDGRRATTHWRHSAALARHHPRVQVMADRIWVNDGSIWTSAGVAAGIDLALALVTDDFGAAAARACAREVVVYYQRPGGQSQFSTIEALSDPRGRFAPLLAWIRANLQQPLRVETLAEQACMSPRHFARRFRAEVGCTPAQAVARIRMEVARVLVETTARPIEAIAQQTGFGDPETMRRAFVRAFGHSPRAVRTGARRVP